MICLKLSTTLTPASFWMTVCYKVHHIRQHDYHDRTPGCIAKMVIDLGWEPLEHRRTTKYSEVCFKPNLCHNSSYSQTHKRSTTTISTSCYCVSRQDFHLPNDHSRVEHFTHLRHICHHLGRIPYWSPCSHAVPSVLTINTDCFNQLLIMHF